MVGKERITIERRALVTGGANGIGWAICCRLAADGFKIALADVDAEMAVARVAELGAGHSALAVDLTDQMAAAALPGRAVAALGGLDVIVNNAGMTDISGCLLTELSDASFDRLVALNLTSVETICDAALTVMPSGGRIVNLASGAAWRPLALRGPYSATKAGIVALTRALAPSLAEKGIAISAVAPGYTRTPLLEELHRSGRVDLDKVAATIPMGRLARPEDIAAAVAFAVGPDAGAIAGETVLVDGGGSAGPPANGKAPEVGSQAKGGLGCIDPLGIVSGSGADAASLLPDFSNMAAMGPLAAVIDCHLFDLDASPSAILGDMLETARRCASLEMRCRDFALLYVLEEGNDAKRATSIAAAEMLARTLALEWAPARMRVNTLRWRGASRKGLWACCRFLVGPDAGFITGQAISAGAT